MKEMKKLDQLYESLPDRIIKLFSALSTYNPKVNIAEEFFSYRAFQVQEEKLGTVENLCAVIFVNQRYVAYIMKVMLERFPFF